MGKIVKLNPFICEKIWGGKKLSGLKNITSKKKIGETWEVSTHHSGPCLIDKMKLSDICDLSYLVKFIDTSDNLSIQVHPHEEYAKQHENEKGKTECWLILEADKRAGIYLGLKKNVTKKEFFTAADAGLEIDKYLNFIPVKKGDFFLIPAGSIHAIGKGITLCEVQQSSGVTYRVWDWNRVDDKGNSRELHIEKAKDVVNFSDLFNSKLLEYSKRNLLEQIGISTIVEHDDFTVQLFSNVVQKKLEINLKEKESIVILEGSLGGDISLNKLESAFVLEEGYFEFKVEKGTSFLVVS